MKTVDCSNTGACRSKLKQIVCLPLLCIAFANTASAALVTSIVTFDESDGFSVSDSPTTNPSVNGGNLYVIDGMRFSVTGGDFLYPRNGSGLWPTQASMSTSLGSAASNNITFSMMLDNPYAGQTFDMHEITLYGYAQAASAAPSTDVEFIGTKLNGNTVSFKTNEFDPGSLSPFLFDFEDDTVNLEDGTTVDFSGLVSLTWKQRNTNRQFQFDNVTFSTVTAVPEPGSLAAMLLISLVGMGTRARSIRSMFKRRLLPS
ncbi:PEP-CTERM sorting domain-containing protein [Rhodopirellula sp. JC737]|nr:PEP-CTERM sorting domain-containing protein [Rhodopirellula sp. JC737]